MKKTIRFLILTSVLGTVSLCVSAEFLSYRTWICYDQAGEGIEAFRVLVPVQWETQGGIRWNFGNPSLPAVAALRIFNPRGSEEVEIFPTRAFFWSDDPPMRSIHPVGSFSFGAEARPLLSPGEYIRQVLIPSQRSGAAGLRITEMKAIPELARLADAAAPSRADFSRTAEGGMVGIEYERAGRTMEEKIFAAVWSFSFPVRSAVGDRSLTCWSGDYLFSVKAGKGGLAPAAETFWKIVSSFKVNPLWQSLLARTAESWALLEIQRTRNIGLFGQWYAQQGGEIREQNRRSWERRQKAYDRMSDEFSRYLLGPDSRDRPRRKR